MHPSILLHFMPSDLPTISFLSLCLAGDNNPGILSTRPNTSCFYHSLAFLQDCRTLMRCAHIGCLIKGGASSGTRCALPVVSVFRISHGQSTLLLRPDVFLRHHSSTPCPAFITYHGGRTPRGNLTAPHF